MPLVLCPCDFLALATERRALTPLQLTLSACSCVRAAWGLHDLLSRSLWALQDENTRYIDIGPVNKALNLLSCYFENPDSIAFKR